MEDKKRVHSETSLSEQPSAKRQNRGNEKDDSPLNLTNQEDLETFQKEAIWRQMQVYKRERDLVQDEINKIKTKYASLQSTFSTLDVWWDQVIDQVVPKTKEESEASIPPTLLFNAVGDKDLGDVLEKKNHLIKEKLGPILKHLEPKDGGSGNQQQEMLSNLSSMLNRVRAENDQLLLSKSELSAKVEELTEKYLESCRKYDRQTSASLNRIYQASTAAAEASKKENNDSSGEQNDQNDNAQVSQEILREKETLKAGFEELQSVAEKQRSQLEQQDQQILDLKHRLSDYSNRLQNLGPDDLRKSDVFQSLRMKSDDLSSKLNRARSKLEKKEKDLYDMTTNEQNYKLQVRERYEKEKEDLEKAKQKLENDVARIRQGRDKILGELNEKKAVEKEHYKSLDQLKDLVKIREERIKALESEVERLKPLSESDSTAAADEETSDVDALKKLVADLKRQNKSLSVELPAMEEAFKDAHIKASAKVFDVADTEARMKKYAAEKAKADEKYFGAMRAKDALSNELEKVKTQLTKSSDALSQLREQERKRSLQIDDLNKRIQQEMDKKRSREEEIHSLKRKVTELEDHLKASQSREDRLKHDLRLRDDDAQKHALSKRDLEIQIEKLKRQADTKKFLSGANGGMEGQLQELRSMTLCSVCSRNFKNTAIKNCGHTLCNDCAQDRLNARLRKCPMCNKQYSYTDLISIHL